MNSWQIMHFVGVQEEILHVASVTQVDGITTVSHRWQKPRASEGPRVTYDELQQPFGGWKGAPPDLVHGWRCARLSLIWVRTKASDDQSKSAEAEVRDSTSTTCCRTERCRECTPEICTGWFTCQVEVVTNPKQTKRSGAAAADVRMRGLPEDHRLPFLCHLNMSLARDNENDTLNRGSPTESDTWPNGHE